MTPDQLFGLTDTHLATWTDTRIGAGKSWRLHADVPNNWQAMIDAAKRDGVCILPVSTFRDFNRQLLIWNEKFTGLRPVHDDAGQPLKRADFSDAEWLHKLLRFSALPGLSRHHWGTEIDVFDGEAVQRGVRPQLLTSEFCAEGPCATLNDWLSEHAAEYGFFRPYRHDNGGIAPEPWHLSYAPVSRYLLADFPRTTLQTLLRQNDIAGRELVLAQFDAIFERYANTLCREFEPA